MFRGENSEGPFTEWALFVFASVFTINLVHWLVARHQLQSEGLLKTQLIAEINELKKEAARLNTPSTFAQCAKCQRQAAAKEKQLGALGGSNGADKVLEVIKKVLSYSKMVLAAGIAYFFWGHHLLDLPVSISWPMNRTLGLPHGSVFSSFGFIAPLPWFMACNRASNLFIQAMLPVLMHKPVSKAAATAAASVPQIEKKNQ